MSVLMMMSLNSRRGQPRRAQPDRQNHRRYGGHPSAAIRREPVRPCVGQELSPCRLPRSGTTRSTSCVSSAEGSVLAAGVVAASAGFDVYLGISEPTAGGRDLVASLSYRGADKQTTEHIHGFDYAFDSVGRGQACSGRCARSKTSLHHRHRATAERSNHSSARGYERSGHVDAPRRLTVSSTTGWASVR